MDITNKDYFKYILSFIIKGTRLNYVINDASTKGLNTESLMAELSQTLIEFKEHPYSRMNKVIWQLAYDVIQYQRVKGFKTEKINTYVKYWTSFEDLNNNVIKYYIHLIEHAATTFYSAEVKDILTWLDIVTPVSISNGGGNEFMLELRELAMTNGKVGQDSLIIKS